jgi:hypothetical protein
MVRAGGALPLGSLRKEDLRLRGITDRNYPLVTRSRNRRIAALKAAGWSMFAA